MSKPRLKFRILNLLLNPLKQVLGGVPATPRIRMGCLSASGGETPPRTCFRVFLALLVIVMLAQPAFAKETNRFFYSGDGALTINGQTLTFRNPDGSYNEAGLKRVHQIFQAPWEALEERLSLRFIEILDYVQDHFGGNSYSLKSGYRNPQLNQSLRNRGKLAAQSSMHIEGAAGDLKLQGVDSSEVFDFVKSLNCCGIGWYHSQHFHLDTGPARYWDEATSKTEDNTPQQNEKIILQPDFDRYLPGETLALKWMRVSEYPFGVPGSFELVKLPEASELQALSVKFNGSVKDQNNCEILDNRTQARTLSVKLPDKNLAPGNYALKVKFCNRYGYEKMPVEIISRQFEILGK